MRLWQPKIDNTAPAGTGILTAAQDNSRGLELNEAVIASGLTPDPVDGPDTRTTHLAESLVRHASLGVFCSDTGTGNATVLSITGAAVAPTALFTGLRVKWYANGTNTGAMTLNAFGLGAKKFLTDTSSAMAGGEVVASREIEADYNAALDGGAGAWRIAPWANSLRFSQGGGGTPNGTQVVSGEGVTVNTASPYDVKLNFPGLSTGTPVDADLFAFYHADSSPPQGTTRHKTVTFANLVSTVKTLIVNQLGGPVFKYGDVGSYIVIFGTPDFYDQGVYVGVPVNTGGFGGTGARCSYLKKTGAFCPGPDNGLWLFLSSVSWSDGAGGASSGDRTLSLSQWVRVS